MKIRETFIRESDCFRRNQEQADSRYTTFQTRGPMGLMLHSVGCPQSDARVFVQTWDRPGADVAVHAVLQADGTVYQCMPWWYRGWHCGGKGNDTHIGVEMTEPDCIRYTSGSTFQCLNLEAAREQARGTYSTAVELFALLCEKYALDPLAEGVIISHKEGFKRGIASNHGDPEHLWRQLGLPYTMDTFRADVQKKLLKMEEIDMTKEELQKTIQEALDADRKARTYDTLEAVPEWGKAAVEKLTASGALKGTGDGKLDISYDLLRIMVLLDRRSAI